MDENKMLDLGWANGWGETPEVVRTCQHPKVDVAIGSCLHQVTCPECRFTYRYDSGDCGS